MNLRYWGGWFLAIACVCIFLTMGCGNGALGVKYSTVMGRLVNKDNIALGVANATVRMISKEAVGTGDLPLGNNFLSTTTDSEGYFIFERVEPDNVVFEFQAPGYAKTIYPSDSETTEEDGSSSEALDIDSVSIRSGETVDLANIMMQKVSTTLPEKINVKLSLVDAKSKEPISDNLVFCASFDGVTYTHNVREWREFGVDDIMSANEIVVNVREDSDSAVYFSATKNISGSSDQFVIIELEPVTYTVTMQFLHVPQYILNSSSPTVLNILVETLHPVKCISTNEVSDFKQLATLNVPAIKSPQRLRIRMEGYEDEVIDLSGSLNPGTMGNYRIDVDFDYSDGKSGEAAVTMNEFQNACSVGMKDNLITKQVQMNMIGLAYGDKVKANIDLPFESLTWAANAVSSDYEDGCLADADGFVSGIFDKVPVGYDLNYTIEVTTVASGSYLVTSNQGIHIPNPGKDVNLAKRISLDLSKKTATDQADK